MKRIFLLSLVVLGFVIFDWQSAAAQFPKIKIPKVSQPTPQPTPADTTQTSVQPATGKNTQPAQPPGGDRGTTITAGAGPAINKPSVQITLRTHQQYYRGAERDQETWSWTPRIAFRVNGPISAGSQLSVEFTLPSGKPWIKFNCATNETKDLSWWHTECGINTNDVKDEEASIERVARKKLRMLTKVDDATRNDTIAGMSFISVGIACDLRGVRMYLYFAATVKDRALWFVAYATPDSDFERNFEAYFAPMLNSMELRTPGLSTP